MRISAYKHTNITSPKASFKALYIPKLSSNPITQDKVDRNYGESLFYSLQKLLDLSNKYPEVDLIMEHEDGPLQKDLKFLYFEHMTFLTGRGETKIKPWSQKVVTTQEKFTTKYCTIDASLSEKTMDSIEKIFKIHQEVFEKENEFLKENPYAKLEKLHSLMKNYYKSQLESVQSSTLLLKTNRFGKF